MGLHNSPQAQIQNKPQKPVVWRRSFELTVAKDRVLDDDDDWIRGAMQI